MRRPVTSGDIYCISIKVRDGLAGLTVRFFELFYSNNLAGSFVSALQHYAICAFPDNANDLVLIHVPLVCALFSVYSARSVAEIMAWYGLAYWCLQISLDSELM